MLRRLALTGCCGLALAIGGLGCGGNKSHFDAANGTDAQASDATTPGDVLYADSANTTIYTCGNAVIDVYEQCDDGNKVGADGCSPLCQVEPGFVCPAAGKPCRTTTPTCGDGYISTGEACDDGNKVSSDGCSADCKVEPNYVCETPGKPCVSTERCGDGRKTGNEACDDGNTTSNDGCSAQCQAEAGWSCAVVGAACVPVCGDGIVKGLEQCDDRNTRSGDGCDSLCQYEPGYSCLTAGAACTLLSCGNSVREGGEQCDDGNHNFGDGCTPLCALEPNCAGGPCKSRCGDGFTLPADNEECDDGNTRAGDGCSPDCKVEKGYACAREPREMLSLPIVIRDFKAADVAGGHPDFEYKVTGLDLGIVQTSLDPASRKPVYAHGTAGTPSTHSQAYFDQWYRDVSGVNMTFLQTLPLTRQTDAQNHASYAFHSTAFFPIDGQGFGNSGKDGNGVSHNFHFTSETRYWFQHRGGEHLDFTGDDDVWFFINGHLAVDIGGVHGAISRSITLDATNAATFGLQVGQVYELAIFQAERHTTASDYQLTLYEFEDARSVCHSVCGDGIVSPDEVCDDGKNDGRYGGCMPGCKARGPYCGDGAVQAASGEQCDDSINQSQYGGCAAGCKLAPRCGDAHVDSLFGEMCDEGTAANTGKDGHCKPDCSTGARCGDGIVQSWLGEQCDDGNAINNDTCSNACRLVTIKPPIN